MAHTIQELVSRLSCDPDLRAGLAGATTTEEALAVAAEHGLPLDQADIRTLALAGSDPAALTPAELECSGGATANPYSIYVCSPTEVMCTAPWLRDSSHGA